MALVAQQLPVIDRPFARYLPPLLTRKALIGLAWWLGRASPCGCPAARHRLRFPRWSVRHRLEREQRLRLERTFDRMQKYLIRATPSWLSREAWLWRRILYR